MHGPVALIALFLLGASGVGAQVLDDAWVPAGLARVEVSPVFTSWDSRFGAGGEERLGEDLTSSAAHTLFPGMDALRSAVEAMTGTSGYAPIFGETEARVTADITRVELGAHIGIFDWLTIGAMVPLVRTRTSLDVWFRPDTIAGDLGITPGSLSAAPFLANLTTAETSAQANAMQVCGTSPGTPECASAQALADRTSGFLASASSAYGASVLFPLASSATATALAQSVATLSADLTAAGLPGITAAMPFATERVTEAELWGLPEDPPLGYAGPLGSVKAPWYAGDMEITATVRLFGLDATDAAESPRGLDAEILLTGLVRLPTGAVEDPDVLLDVGAGDGQTDFEGRVLARFAAGPVGLHVGGRYGIQGSRTLVRRVTPPESILAPLSTRQLVEWEPGSYYGIEIAPVWRFTEELNLVGEYRAFQKRRDAYRLAGQSVGAPVDASVLGLESGVTLHEVGGSLRYDTVGRLGSGVRPIQAHLRIMYAVAGNGGQTPVTTQVELGVRLFRRLWGN